MLGIDDEKFLRGKIPMTKREIRILTLANAEIAETDFVVDIGAGTGSLSIEAALIAKRGQVFAIEKNLDATNLVAQNADKFDVDNLTIIHAEAPYGLQKIPKINVALIGGSGGNLVDILDALDAKIENGGRIVMNFITIQSLATCLGWLKNQPSYKYDAIQVQINRLQNLGNYDMSKSLNPVHIVTAKKIHSKQAANVISLAAAKKKIFPAANVLNFFKYDRDYD